MTNAERQKNYRERLKENTVTNVTTRYGREEQSITEQNNQSSVLSDQIQKSDSELRRANGHEGHRRPSVFDSLTPETLTDAVKLREWFVTQGKARKPILSQSRESWELVCAAACQAVAEGDIPIARFKFLVTKGKDSIEQRFRIRGLAFAKEVAA